MTTETSTEGYLESLLEGAETAPEPGETREKDIVHRGDEGLPAPMGVTQVSSAGYYYIYDTITGDRSTTNRNMLPTQLSKLRSDGTRVFSTRRPVDDNGNPIAPKMGRIKCRLHADDPEREYFDELGLAHCVKSNLASAYQLQVHMAHRHPQEWAAIESEREALEREEDRAFQRHLFEAATLRSVPVPAAPERSSEKIQSDKDKMARARAAKRPRR